MIKRIIDTSAFVQSYAIGAKIYLLSDNRIQVFANRTFEKIAEKQLFEKDGLARSFILDDNFIYCKDFIDLYILGNESLSVLAKLQLGTDLSSDICGMTMDGKKYVYAGIRNGAIARIDRTAWDVQYFPLSTSSIWTMKYDQNRIYAGNVEGQLLVIDPEAMNVEKRIQAHKQNLKSLYIFDQLIATASQDKSLSLWDRQNLVSIQAKRNAHKKSFSIIGTWKDYLLTVSFPCGEIKVWDQTTLREKMVLPIASCLSGKGSIHDSKLYLGSRAINGIDCAELATLIV